MVITHHSQDRLLSDLNALKINNPTYRCLHLHLSGFVSTGHENWLSDLGDLLGQCLDDDVIRIHCCDDQDVIVFSRTLNYKNSERITRGLSSLFDYPIPKNISELFEVGIHWEILEDRFKRKSQKARQGPKEDNQKSQTKDVLTLINPELIKTISDRRQGRADQEVMIVEDDLFSQRLVGNALKDTYSISATSDGKGAILSYVKKAPDVLFLDIGLPDIDGLNVLEKIFACDPEAYIVMLSGDKHKDTILKAIELGASGYVGKPFQREKLIRYIEKSPHVRAKQNKGGSHAHTTLH